MALSRYSHCGRGRSRTEWIKFPVQAKTMLRRWMLPAQLILLFLTLGGTVGWTETVEEHEAKAAYIYGFAQFTIWPKLPEKGVDFCVHGNHPVGDALRKLRGKKLAERASERATCVFSRRGQKLPCSVPASSESQRTRTVDFHA